MEWRAKLTQYNGHNAMATYRTQKTDLVEKFKTEHELRIYRVVLAAELKSGSRLPTGEYTPPDTTQLDSTCSVFNCRSASNRREL